MENNQAYDSVIAKQIEQIQAKYPAEKLAKLRSYMESFWDGKITLDRFPYYVYTGPKEIPQLPEDSTPWETELVSQLQTIIDHAEWEDEFYPALSPGIRQVSIPSYFGCVEEFASDSVKVKPAIAKPEDVYSLPQIGYTPETAGGEMIEKMRFWRKKTKGLITLYEADLQGPFSVASQIWEVEYFLAAVYENPEEVKYLLQLCTNAVIEYVKGMREAAEGDFIPFHCLPAFWYPRNKGIALSEDLLAVVSPPIFRKFIKPCLEQITDTFGGVFVHSCGSVNHLMEDLNEVRGLTGLNFSSVETDLEEAVKKKKSSISLIVHNSPVHRVDLPLLKDLEHVEYCGKIFRDYQVNGLCEIFQYNGELSPERDGEMIEKALARS